MTNLMTRLRWRWAAVAVLAIAVIVVVGMVGRSVLGGRDRTWARIQETGVWRIGMDPSFPPFENLDTTTNEPVGLDVDLANALAARMGVRAEFVGIGFDQLMDAVVAHRVDSALSALPVAMERTQEMRFSEPYIEAGMVLAVPEGSPLTSALEAATGRGNAPLSDVAPALAGQRVAVEWGSVGDSLARSLQTQLNGNLHLVLRNSTDEALSALAGGDADIAIVDAISLSLFGGTGARLVAVGQPLRSDPYAIVIPVDAPELLRRVNTALAALQADGTLAAIKARWLAPKAP